MATEELTDQNAFPVKFTKVKTASEVPIQPDESKKRGRKPKMQPPQQDIPRSAPTDDSSCPMSDLAQLVLLVGVVFACGYLTKKYII